MPEKIQRGLRARKVQIRRFAASLAACCFALLASQALLASFPTSAAPASSCTDLRRWAETYRNTSPTLDRIASFDRRHRIAVLNVVSPETQAALWREHLRRFAEHSELSDRQRQLIAEGIVLTTPALYRHDAAANRAMDDLERRAKPEFTTRQELLPWYDLGQVGERPTTPVRSAWDRLASGFRAEAEAQFCECTTAATEVFCPGGCMITGTCQFSGGCGWDGRSVCNGICTY